MNGSLKEKKNYIHLDIDKCSVMGMGAKATVYRYGKNEIVKVHKNPRSYDEVKKERELTAYALSLGIPTAMPYEIVKVGRKYGAVYELLDARTISELLSINPERIDFYVGIYSGLLKQIHSTKVSVERVPDIRYFAYGWSDIAALYLQKDEKEKIDNLIKSLPERQTMLHCDYHTNNIMLTDNGKTLIIDMETLSYGHPIFELANIYYAFVGKGEANKKTVEKFLGLPYTVSCEFMSRFLSEYVGTSDKKVLEDIENKARIIAYIHILASINRSARITKSDEKLSLLCQSSIKELLKKVDSLDFTCVRQ